MVSEEIEYGRIESVCGSPSQIVSPKTSNDLWKKQSLVKLASF